MSNLVGDPPSSVGRALELVFDVFASVAFPDMEAVVAEEDEEEMVVVAVEVAPVCPASRSASCDCAASSSSSPSLSVFVDDV